MEQALELYDRVLQLRRSRALRSASVSLPVVYGILCVYGMGSRALRFSSVSLLCMFFVCVWNGRHHASHSHTLSLLLSSFSPYPIPFHRTAGRAVLSPGEEKRDAGIAEALHAIGSTHHIMADFPTAIPYLKARHCYMCSLFFQLDRTRLWARSAAVAHACCCPSLPFPVLSSTHRLTPCATVTLT